MSRFEGFAPVYDGGSRLLILGSFPSVKSRQEGFYYGNPQNRFWRMLCSFFGENVPATIAEKREFLLRNGVALWDMVASCEVKGSADASIKEAEAVDLSLLLARAPMEAVFCNGTTAYGLLAQNFPSLLSIARKLPSTSPANPRYREEIWHAALGEVFGAEGAKAEFRQNR